MRYVGFQPRVQGEFTSSAHLGPDLTGATSPGPCVAALNQYVVEDLGYHVPEIQCILEFAEEWDSIPEEDGDSSPPSLVAMKPSRLVAMNTRFATDASLSRHIPSADERYHSFANRDGGVAYCGGYENQRIRPVSERDRRDPGRFVFLTGLRYRAVCVVEHAGRPGHALRVSLW